MPKMRRLSGPGWIDAVEISRRRNAEPQPSPQDAVDALAAVSPDRVRRRVETISNGTVLETILDVGPPNRLSLSNDTPDGDVVSAPPPVPPADLESEVAASPPPARKTLGYAWRP